LDAPHRSKYTVSADDLLENEFEKSGEKEHVAFLL
jgi:hypothetical protein